MARLMIVLSREEIQQETYYPLICQTMCGAVWNTGKRRRRWAAEFTESERRACYKLKSQAHRWYLGSGVPEEVTMSISTLALWRKLADFCASI